MFLAHLLLIFVRKKLKFRLMLQKNSKGVNCGIINVRELLKKFVVKEFSSNSVNNNHFISLLYLKPKINV